MSSFSRLLLIHPDLQTSLSLAPKLQEFGDEVEMIHSGIEGVATYESYDPDIVFVSADLQDLPTSFMIPALHQLNPLSVIVVLRGQGDEPPSTYLGMGARAVLGEDFNPRELTELLRNQTRPQEDSQDETIQGWIDDSSSFDELMNPDQTKQMKAKDLPKDRFCTTGNLIIQGDLRGYQHLDVGGNLTIYGDCDDVHIRAKGDVFIHGDVTNCGRLGVFSRSSLIVKSVDQSVLVSGGNFIFEGHCLNSMVNAARRMIGLGRGCQVAGGTLKIGQYLAVGVLGDEVQSPTHIEMSPTVFAKQMCEWFLGMSQTRASLGSPLNLDRQNHLAYYLSHPKSFVKFAEVVSHHIHPGVSFKMNGAEELVITERKQTSRITFQAGINGGSDELIFTVM